MLVVRRVYGIRCVAGCLNTYDHQGIDRPGARDRVLALTVRCSLAQRWHLKNLHSRKQQIPERIRRMMQVIATLVTVSVSLYDSRLVCAIPNEQSGRCKRSAGCCGRQDRFQELDNAAQLASAVAGYYQPACLRLLRCASMSDAAQTEGCPWQGTPLIVAELI